MKRMLFLILYLPLIAFPSIVFECRYDKNSILPVDVVNLVLPEGEEAESLKVEVLTSRILTKIDEIKTPPNYLDYKKESLSPEVRAELIGTNVLAGNSIARIAVYPLVSLPGENKIIFYDNIRLTVYTNSSGKHNISQKVRTQYSDIEGKALRSIIDNDYEISLLPKVRGAVRSLNTEYIIITNESLKSGFEIFANYLKKKGIIAEITTVEDIISTQNYYDHISGLHDPPGAIRGYLMEKYEEGVNWVLLGGDEDIVPVRYGTYSRNDTFVDFQAPSDLYYSDLNGNWNVDGDEFLGEPLDDSVDVFPELYVGRIPCDNLQEVSNWFEKLVSYETNPGQGNAEYLTKILWTGSDDVRDGPAYTIENAQLPGYISHDTTLLEETDGLNPKGSDVIKKMNEHFGLLFSYGHGSPDNITVSAPGNNSPSKERNFLVSLDSVDWQGNCRNDPGNGLDSLKNKGYYSIFSAASCFQAAFDWEKFPERFWYTRAPCMGEIFTVYPDAGGPAFRGYTRYGGQYVQLGILETSFLNKLFVDKITNIGVAEALSKNEFPFYYVQSNHTLLGCPLMRVWTDIPGKMNVYHDTLINTGFKNVIITVTEDTLRCKGNGVSNTYVCLWKGNEVYERGYTDENGHLSLQINPTTGGTMSITVTKENMLPYEGKITVKDGIKLLAEKISADQTDRSQWHSVNFPETYNNPIIVMGPPSYNDSSPTTIRIKDVESNGFKFQIEEWGYLDGIHGEETISFLAMEQGVHCIGGKTWEAGRICCPTYENWITVNFKSRGFKCYSDIIVLTQTVTDNLDFPVVTRIKDITPYGFKAMIQNEENNEDLHKTCHEKPELIHYIAIQTGSGKIKDNEIFTATKTSPGQTPAIDHEWNTIDFPVIDTLNAPVFLAGMQTSRPDIKKHRCEKESDPASLRYRDITNTEVKLKVEEEQSADLEVEHSAEDIGYLTVFKTTKDTSAIDNGKICENYIKPAASITMGTVILNVSSNSEKRASIELIDIAGRIIEKQDYKLKAGKQQLNFGQFKSGIYFFRILQERETKPEVYKITVLR